MAYCGAKTRAGTPCKRPAGWGTDHVGTGKCKLHGGASTGAPIKHGRYSLKHRGTLAAKAEQYLNDPEPANLMHELALNRTLLQDYLDRFPDGVPISANDIDMIFKWTSEIGRMVERISHILNDTALTQAEVQFLQARLADLIVKYIDEPDKRVAFVVELQQSFSAGGGRSGALAGLTDGRNG